MELIEQVHRFSLQTASSIFTTQNTYVVSDFRLLPRSSWELRSSGSLRCE